MKKHVLYVCTAVLLTAGAAPLLASSHEKGKHFEKMDTNGDGVVDKQEFMQKFEDKFGMMDGDKDGKVTRDEMKAHHDAMKEKRREMREEYRKEHPEDGEHHGSKGHHGCDDD